jgi:hypothetical protein
MSSEKFIAGLELQELLRDKDTGLPLSSGTVTFYEDANRLNLKPVFKYTGSPGNPTFAPLPNPLGVNGAGMPVDAVGDPVAIYYFPFDDTGAVDLYFIEVRNTGGVLQNTREAWPPGIAQSSGGTPIDINFIPNGQFSVWGAGDNSAELDSLTAAVSNKTQLAAGNWIYENTPGTTTNVAFTFINYGLNPPPGSNAPFALQSIVVANDPSDSIRDISVIFNPVNAFASDTQSFTYSFWGETGDASTAVLSLYLKKEYGVGGSPLSEELLTTFTLTGTMQQFTFNFIFGDDAGKVLGTGATRVFLSLRLPLTIPSNTITTNYLLTEGNITAPLYPVTTIAQARSASFLDTIGTDQRGSQIGLPVIQGRYNFEFDLSQLGSPYAVFREPNQYELKCDGSAYFTNEFSAIGIPFSRLQSIYGQRFGTGLNYVLMKNKQTLTDVAWWSTNTTTAVGIPVNVSASLITITAIHTSNLSVDCIAGKPISLANELILINLIAAAGIGGIFGNGTAPVTVEKINGNGIWDPATLFNGSGIPPSADSAFGWRIIFLGIPAAGQYFRFAANAPTMINFYVWYKVDGGGADPAVGGATGIEIDITTGDTITEVIQQTAQAVQGFVMANIKFASAAAMGAGGYWIFDGNGETFYVWYTIDGAGTDPAVAGRRGIQVNLLSTDTAAQVCSKTVSAVNSFKFAVPDLRGMTLRGYDSSGFYDHGYLQDRFLHRTNSNLVNPADIGLGTIQWPINLNHSHQIVALASTKVTGGSGSGSGPNPVLSFFNLPFAYTFNNAANGYSDNRPWNVAVNWVIKY